MSTLSPFASVTITLTEESTILIQLDIRELASVRVTRGSDVIYESRPPSTQNIGPFKKNDVVVISSDGATVDYFVTTFVIEVSPLVGISDSDGVLTAFRNPNGTTTAIGGGGGPITSLEITDATTPGRALLTSASAAAQRDRKSVV